MVWYSLQNCYSPLCLLNLLLHYWQRFSLTKLYQAPLNPLWTGCCPWILSSRTRIIIQFSENPPPWKSDQISHSHYPQVMSDHSGLPSARIHASPYPWCYRSVIFHPLTPLLSLAISPHLSMLYLDLTPILFHICSLFSPTEIILG